MSILTYLKIAAIALLAAALFGGGWYVNGERWTVKYDGLVTQDAQASEKARIDADTANAQIAAVYQTKLTTTEQNYESSLASGRAASARLIASLRNYAHQHSGSPVPGSAAAPGGADAAGTSDSNDSSIASAAGLAIEACTKAAAELTALQAERASLNSITITGHKAN